MSPRVTLFVSEIGENTTQEDLRTEFIKYGDIVRCDIPPPRSRTKIIAFIEYRDPNDAETAYNEMHGKEINGSRISIQWSKSKPKNTWRIDNKSESRDFNRNSRPHRRDPIKSYDYSRRSRSPRPSERGRYRYDNNRERYESSDYDNRSPRHKTDRIRRYNYRNSSREDRYDRSNRGNKIENNPERHSYDSHTRAARERGRSRSRTRDDNEQRSRSYIERGHARYRKNSIEDHISMEKDKIDTNYVRIDDRERSPKRR
ncbi:hypothetical protein BB559_000770 [Furculomyces boomerangus]|uniref:RRM domain-containing protein n=2 Tax=Harpellales TaxID=61421 RepID=A0A2T9Z495_9FUNG|nr:hypothetical protein BB559_000770 [Furculomyces boomerangus]PVZ98765.1 hypothetical protein BB558_005232 [Smittium angustum]